MRPAVRARTAGVCGSGLALRSARRRVCCPACSARSARGSPRCGRCLAQAHPGHRAGDRPPIDTRSSGWREQAGEHSRGGAAPAGFGCQRGDASTPARGRARPPGRSVISRGMPEPRGGSKGGEEARTEASAGDASQARTLSETAGPVRGGEATTQGDAEGARAVAAAAWERLRTAAARLRDPARRESYLTRVPLNAELLAMCDRLGVARDGR